MSENGEHEPGIRVSLSAMPASKSYYQALISRDRRFDGLFYVGVTSTGIYCRPICPTKPPKKANCRFYKTPQEAEHFGFRPCLRCRPELAPGVAPVDKSERIAQQILQRIEESTTNESQTLEDISAGFSLSSRQIRRIILKELGVAPIQLLLTRRLLLAKQLLTETNLPVTEIAFASGFASLRRFNDAFLGRYAMPPSRLRKKAISGALSGENSSTSTLQLSYRPPYDWVGVLAFLKARELKGVEWITDEFYARTVRLGNSLGWIKIKHVEKTNALTLEFTHSLTPVLPALLNRVRGLFDLDAQPQIIGQHLAKNKSLAPLIKANPGIRVPGAFDAFEMGLRAILGQQITVKAATTLAARVATGFGESIVTPFPELNRLTPTAETLVKALTQHLTLHGIIRTRSNSILALAQAYADGELSSGARNFRSPEDIIQQLKQIPGIGPWTANYIAMRVLRWPDAFPAEDIVVRRKLGNVTAKQAEEISQTWRPWRSYAVLHLWKN